MKKSFYNSNAYVQGLTKTSEYEIPDKEENSVQKLSQLIGVYLQGKKIYKKIEKQTKGLFYDLYQRVIYEYGESNNYSPIVINFTQEQVDAINEILASKDIDLRVDTITDYDCETYMPDNIEYINSYIGYVGGKLIMIIINQSGNIEEIEEIKQMA